MLTMEMKKNRVMELVIKNLLGDLFVELIEQKEDKEKFSIVIHATNENLSEYIVKLYINKAFFENDNFDYVKLYGVKVEEFFNILNEDEETFKDFKQEYDEWKNNF